MSIYPEDAFISDGLVLSALRAAIASGVIDRLAAEAVTDDRKRGLEPLRPEAVRALNAAGVVELDAARPALSSRFGKVWAERRPWLLPRLNFMAVAAADLLTHADAMMLDPWRLQEVGSTFRLFDYSAAMTTDAEAVERCRPWVDYVTARTEAEAPFLMKTIGPWVAGVDVVEIGGNSGAFARAMLASGARSVSVMDLPAVCAIGEAENAELKGGRLLRFIPGDARAAPWPRPVDTVIFKSVLHDWPDDDACRFIDRAISAIEGEGGIIICERAPLDPGDERPAILRAEDMVFAPFFRGPHLYVAALVRGGLDVTVAEPSADLPFFVVSGRC